MAVERKETEKLVDELMKMNIPAYEPSANHIQLSNTGIITRYTKNREAHAVYRLECSHLTW